MKIGIISDVHANLPALKQALALLAIHHPDSIICAGDLVDRGDDNDAVVMHMRQAGIPTVRGNHDFSGARNSFFQPETRKFLHELPPELRFEWEGRSVYVTHASPWSHMHYIFPYVYDSQFRRVIREAQADIVILGHTHTPMQATLPDGSVILNPGTTNPAANYNGNFGTCAVLTLGDEIDFAVYNTQSGQPVHPQQVTVR
ncbi:MAG: YfcE family phosphodiesterase, partial [Chloroflexota bacterium]